MKSMPLDEDLYMVDTSREWLIHHIPQKRGKGGFSGGGNDERENTLNQRLVYGVPFLLFSR